MAIRAQLLSGWSSIGLRVGKTSASDTVLGWQVRKSTPDFVLLGATSRIGMPGELMFITGGETLTFATLVRHGNPLARAVWAMVEPAHVRTVRQLLDQGGRRIRAGSA